MPNAARKQTEPVDSAPLRLYDETEREREAEARLGRFYALLASVKLEDNGKDEEAPKPA